MPTQKAEVLDLNLSSNLHALLRRQREALAQRRVPMSLQSRLSRLDRLEKALMENRYKIAAAISKDFRGRAEQESLLELFVVLDDIRHARSHLKSWMKPRLVSANWQFLPGTAQLLPQPLGVIGVIGAYNYPVMTSLSPVVSALAAGNHLMIKPAGQTPETSACLADILNPLFDDSEFHVLTGDSSVAKELSSLPLDHLVFTGSTRVGKLIMRAASEHLVPVTLELGGKCPAIIGDDFDLRAAAESVMHAKMLNAGQTCVTCDYALVPADRVDEFLGHARDVLLEYYPNLVKNPDFTRVLSPSDWQRLQNWVQEAEDAGATVETINPQNENCSAENGVFPPTLVSNCPREATLCREEIFGPVFPVLSYQSLDQAIDFVNAGERPLAAYFFGHRGADQKRVLQETISGGVTINGCGWHAVQHNLPFGGVGASGMGAYHGQGGFDRFSHVKPVMVLSPLSKALNWLRPPYKERAAWVLGFMLHNRLRKESNNGGA